MKLRLNSHKFRLHNVSLTCELCQDLFNGDAAGVGVSVGAVSRDQVVRGVDGCLDACSTRFLWEKTNLRAGLGLQQVLEEL